MNIVLILFFVLIIISSSLSKKGEFNGEYLSKDGTLAIKGIFVLIVLFSHTTSYIGFNGAWDTYMTLFIKKISQLMVVMFWFYSGYGIMEQIKKRGRPYVKSIMTKRFPSLFINMALAVILFALVKVIFGEKFTVSHFLLSLIGWTSLGNSNWFIFDTFAMYVITFAAFMIAGKIKSEKSNLFGVILTGFFTLILMAALHLAGKEGHWINTVHIYTLGMFYSLYRPEIEKIVIKNDRFYLISLIALILAFIPSYIIGMKTGIVFLVTAAVFTLLIVVITMKVRVSGKILNWFGTKVFSIYILQRLPIIVLDKVGLSAFNRYLYFAAVIAVTIAISIVFDYLTGKLQSRIFKK